MPYGYLCPMGIYALRAKPSTSEEQGKELFWSVMWVSCMYEIKQRKKEGGKNGREHV